MSEPFSQYYYASQYPVPEPPRPRRGRHLLGIAATAAVALAAGAGVTLAVQHGSPLDGHATATSTTVLTPAQIASRVDPALVDVTSTLGYQSETAKGTGIVLSADGYILTNNHVINGATKVTVTDVGNGKTYPATVVGYDASHDIAVLKAAGASGLTTASLGDSAAVKAGDSVVALGNAGGTDGTPAVASGTVTALDQSITASDESSGSSEQLSGLIESDADIQAGDSGGPLVNAHGQVIGVDTAASSGYQFGGQGGTASATQGYTIPIDQALSIARQVEAGTASATVHIGATAFLGVSVSASDSSSAGDGGYGFGSYGFGGSGSQVAGVPVEGVASGTPAQQAGIAEGDVITSVAGHAVGASESIQQVLEAYHPGDKVSVSWTDPYGQSHTATVTLGTGPAA